MTLEARVAAQVAGETVAPAASPLEERLDHYLRMAQAGEYPEAYHALRGDRSLNPDEKKAIMGAVNHGLLFDRQREWGNHGVRRSFRFWNDKQKADYVQRTLEIANLMKREITPHVSFGFGSVLGMIRDNDFIPHDDDMDLIIALRPTHDMTFGSVLADIRRVLEENDFYVPPNKNICHLTTARKGKAGTDIFVGFIDSDERLSWFPSARGGFAFEDVFPTQTLNFFGGDCPIPRDPLNYLAVTYGADWRTPIANWNHPWDAKSYGEFLEPRAKPAAPKKQAEPKPAVAPAPKPVAAPAARSWPDRLRKLFSLT